MRQKNVTRQSDALPHHQAKTRIRPSSISGVGVFAISAIKKGEPVFPSDDGEMRWVSKVELESANLSAAEKQFYRDFAIFKSDECGCPVNFDKMTAAWYLNQPSAEQEPNVTCDVGGGYRFYAAREIDEGEELTTRYSDFSLASWL